MQHTGTGTHRLLTIDRGEQVIASLTAFCEAGGITSASFSGIGAVQNVSCGYYDLPTKSYRFQSYLGVYEVVSLQGNVSLKNNSPFVHAHVLCTDEHNQAFGGHLEEMEVAITLEIVITILPAVATREHNEEIGLYLLKL